MPRPSLGEDVYLTPQQEQRGLRNLFLAVMAQEVPTTVESLWRLADEAGIPQWADHWHINAPWVIEAANDARLFWLRYRPGATDPPRGWPPIKDGDRSACWMGDVWLSDEQRAKLDLSDHRHPHNMDGLTALKSLDNFPPIPRHLEKSSTYAKRVRQYEASRRKAFKAAGGVGRVRRRRIEPQYMRWLVLRVVRGMTYKAIAENTMHQCEIENQWRDIKRAIRPLREAIDL